MAAPRPDLSQDEYSTLTITSLLKQGRGFWNFEFRTLPLLALVLKCTVKLVVLVGREKVEFWTRVG